MLECSEIKVFLLLHDELFEMQSFIFVYFGIYLSVVICINFGISGNIFNYVSTHIFGNF